MLQVQNLSIIQKKDYRVLVDNLSFVLNDGEKGALIGEEGNGKSTILKWIADPASVEAYAEVKGTSRTKSRIGYLSQELSGEDQIRSIYSYMEDACALASLPPKNVIRTAKQLGLDADLLWEERTLASLSGGERIKVQLCALLLNNCDLLLLDEPSNDLDLETLLWLERFLQETDKSVLYVSHDEVLLERTAQLILHIEQVRRKSIPRAAAVRMSYRAYMDERGRKMAHQAQVSAFEHDAFQKKKERYLAIYNAVDHAQSAISRSDPSGGRLLKKKMHTVQSLGRRLEKEQEQLIELPEAEWAILPKFAEGIAIPNGKTVLDWNLPVLTAGEQTLAQNVRLHVAGPERICIIGRNGCGKSTLVREIARELLPRKDLSVGYMPQQYDDLLGMADTPITFLATNADKETVTRARRYLGSMKYTTDEMTHPMRELSGGQRAKVLLLKLILDQNNVLILDEPTRNFSPLSNPAVRTLLHSFPGTIIAVSHDRKFLSEVATRVLELTPEGLTERSLHALRQK